MRGARFTVGIIVACGAVACGAVACGESTAPAGERFEGRYVLVAANDGALPLPLYPGWTLTGGSLTVLGRGRVQDVRVYDSFGSEVRDTTVYAYAVSGSRLVVQRPRINPAQTHADTGTLGPGALTLRVRYAVATDGSPTSATLTYQRAP
jgi:hypothetical protein